MTKTDSWLIYLLILSMVCNIRFGSVGLQDFIVVIILISFIVNGRKKIDLRNVSLNGIFLFAVPIMLLSSCIVIKVAFYNESIVFDSITLILKLVMIVFYWNVFKVLNFRKVDYNWLLIFFSIPLVLSLLMYYNPAINKAVLSFYGRNAYPVKTRFGGMYGKDVNAAGLYATLVIILAGVFYMRNVIARGIAIGILSISAIIIVLSGMRAGVIAVFVTIIFMNYIRFGNKGEIVLVQGGLKRLLKIFLFLTMVIILFYLVTEYTLPEALGTMLQDRFSFEHLIGDFKSDGNGNLAGAKRYLKMQLAKCQNSSILFGYDISFSFVDCFYIDIFFKYGLIGIFSLIIFLTCCVKRASQLQYRNYALFLILFALIISIKGTFVLDTKLIFIFIFILNFLQKQRLVSLRLSKNNIIL